MKDFYLGDFESYISSVFSIDESSESSNTFEWEIAKEKLDSSKALVRTKEQAIDFYNQVMDKVKALPQPVKIKIVKYIGIAFMLNLGAQAINSMVSDKLPEISKEIEVAIDDASDKLISSAKSYKAKVMPIKSVNKNVKDTLKYPVKCSDELVDIIKYEEGSIRQKGEPVLKAYKLGDGMITIGWGHAERIRNSKFRVGQEITVSQAEELLSSDIADAERGLNLILSNWANEGVRVQVTQPMYDSMISMIFNMGIGNFRKSEFIQLLKSGKYGDAAERILTTNVSYPGHVPRRQKESELFSRGLELTDLSEVRKLVRDIIGEGVIEETHTGQKDIEKLANDILKSMAVEILKKKAHMVFLTDDENEPITSFPIVNTIMYTGDGFNEIKDFVEQTNIRIAPTELIRGVASIKGELEYSPKDKFGNEFFKISLKYNDDNLAGMNELFKVKGSSITDTDVYFSIFYMWYSTLLHELQHAYDAWRSGGKAFNKQTTKSYTKLQDKARNIMRSNVGYDDLTPEEIKALNDSREAYLNLVHEINARYTQAMAKFALVGFDFNTFDDVKKNWNDVYYDFKKHFDGWNILSDKMKRKMTRRVAKAYQEEIEKMQKAEEKYSKEDLDSIMERRLSEVRSFVGEILRNFLYE